MSDSRNPNLGVVDSRSVEEGGWRSNLGKSAVSLDYPRDPFWWTGKPPQACPGYTRSSTGADNGGGREPGKITSLAIPNLRTGTRQEVRDYFDNGWTLTEVLFSALRSDEAFYRPPFHGLRHPLIFYYVHPATLYINKLLVAGLIQDPVEERLESLFETGVDEMSWDDMSKNEIEWPTLDECIEYRRTAYDVITKIIDAHEGLSDGHEQIDASNPLWALFMGFEHERIHLETSSVLIRELPQRLVVRPSEWPADRRRPGASASSPVEGRDYPVSSMVAVQSGRVTIGKDEGEPLFGWDNEYGRRECRVEAFDVSSNLVSNGEYWEFVADGGYVTESFWSEAGWSWRSFRNVKWPTFWVPDGPAGSHRYRLRTIFEVIEMQWSWPAVVNFHEAQAFLTWKGNRDGKSYRMLSEGEHHRIRALANDTASSLNIDLRYGSEGPVCESDLLRDEERGARISDSFGNVWHWLADHFNPLPGFAVHRYYDDFSTPCFDGEHQMIVGGSFISTGDMATPFARYHFRPHFFQHAGFRVVEGNEDGGAVLIGDSTRRKNRYKNERILNTYVNLHYGSEKSQLPLEIGPSEATCFPQRCARLLVEWCSRLGVGSESALDIGCGVGGATFELARSFDSVMGVDLSEQFIDFACELKKTGTVEFSLREEGDLSSTAIASVDAESRARVNFRRADAMSLPPEFVNFDAVLIANVLCRLASPKACLSRLSGSRGIVRPGGVVLITTPFTWLDDFTPRSVWLGGYEDESGNPIWSFKGLEQAMSPEFELLEKTDLPMIIRRHHREYQYIVPLATVWRRL